MQALFRPRWALLPAFSFVTAMLVASFSANAAIPSGSGWYEIPNTRIRPVCAGETGYPQVLGDTGCSAIVLAWNSGVFDTKRNRLLVWGGGHRDYYGNEVYALDLNSLTMQRLNNPTTNMSDCQDANPDGTPSARHTYDGIEYMPNIDRMFVYGGAMKCINGGFVSGTWTLDLSNLQWQRMSPTGRGPSLGISQTAYDPNTGRVFVHDGNNFYSYNYSTNSYTHLSSNAVSNYSAGAIDPKRKKFVIIGGGQESIYDIASRSSYAQASLNSSGGTTVINSSYPGLVYDPVTDRMIAWNGGDTIYSLNLDTKVWTAITFPGGPGAAPSQGTFQRFNYSPALNAFVVVNSVDQNAFTLRINSTSGTPPPPAPAPARASAPAPSPTPTPSPPPIP
jgi:hypothetical protein